MPLTRLLVDDSTVPADLHGLTEVGAFYWKALALEIVNSGREEQGSVSV
jgi:hypothetical protein